MRPIRIILAIACILSAALASADAVKIGSLSADDLRTMQDKLGGPKYALPRAKSGTDLYKITYPSKDLHGKPTTLSGLLIVPKTGAPNGLVLYFHATTVDRSLSPSRFTGSNGNDEAAEVTLAFAADGGYAVAMPDYLGFGDDNSIHPYPLSEVNSWSGIDMILPARQAASGAGVTIGPRLLITGYSEGGGAAMWALKHLEELHDPTLTPTLAAPLSGPYDLSGATARGMLRHRLSPLDVGARLFLVGYAGYSASKDLDNFDLNNYFSPSFASYVPYVFDQHLTDEDTAKKLALKGLQLGALQSIDKVLTSRFHEALDNGDTTDPFLKLLKQNDCYDWAPQTKMVLVYLGSDSIVPPANSTEAIDAMRARGVTDKVVRAYPIYDAHMNHSSCIPVALMVARKFFDGGFSALGWPKGVTEEP